MKRSVLLVPAALLLAGCASTETGTVYHAGDGTKVYALDEQPQTSVTGQGALMPGAYSNHALPNGQFTGQERTHDVVGQSPVTPREADPRELARTSPPTLGTGAGTLGQTGILPRQNITSGTLVDLPPNLASVAAKDSNTSTTTNYNPTAVAANSQNSQPSAAGGAVSAQTPGGIGGAPGTQTSGANSSSNNPSQRPGISKASLPDESPRGRANAPSGTTLPSADADLPARIRKGLMDEPDAKSNLTRDEIRRLQIDTVNGNVTLRGDVQSEAKKKLIGTTISRIQGVESVNNQLRVVGVPPAAIREQQAVPDPATGVVK